MFVWCVTNVQRQIIFSLHCEMAWNMWNRLFGFLEENWVSPGDLGAFLSTKFRGFGRRKENQTLWLSAVFATLWSIWLERNARVFKSQSLPPHLWNRITFMASLWVSASGLFKGVSLVDPKGLESSIALNFFLAFVLYWEDVLSFKPFFFSFHLFAWLTKYLFFYSKIKKQQKKSLQKPDDSLIFWTTKPPQFRSRFASSTIFIFFPCIMNHINNRHIQERP